MEDIGIKRIIQLSRLSGGITFLWYFFVRYLCDYKVSELYVEALLFTLFLLSPILGDMMVQKGDIKSICSRAFGVGYKVFLIFFWVMWSIYFIHDEKNASFLIFDLICPLLPASFLSAICAFLYMGIFSFFNKDKLYFVEQKQEGASPRIRLCFWPGKPPVQILPSGKNEDKITTREKCARICFIVNAHLSFVFMLFASYNLGIMEFLFLIFLGFPVLFGSAFIAAKMFVVLAKYVKLQNHIVREWCIALVGFSLYQALLLLSVPLGKCEGCFEEQPFVFNIIVSAIFSMVLYMILMTRKNGT